MEGEILLAGEEIEQRTLSPCQFLEIDQASGIDINTAQAAPTADQVAHSKGAVVESGGAGAEAAAEAEVLVFAAYECGLHVLLLIGAMGRRRALLETCKALQLS